MEFSVKVNRQHVPNYQLSSGLQIFRIPSKSETLERKVRSSSFDLELCNLKRAYGVSLEDHESTPYHENILGKSRVEESEDLEKSGDEEEDRSEDGEDQEIDWANGHHPLEFCESQIEEESDISSSQRDEHEYKCRFCFFYGTKKQLQKHNEACHTEEPPVKTRQCPHCHLNFESETGYKLHETQEHVHPCAMCKKNFRKQRFLLAHLPVHSKEKRFKCPTCEKEFPTQRYLVRHMVRHEKRPEGMESEKHSFKCTLCEKIFMKRESLAKHMRIHCRESLKCSQCEFSCEKKVILKMHVLTHEGNRKYKCARCDFSFKQIGHLKRHIARFNH